MHKKASNLHRIFFYETAWLKKLISIGLHCFATCFDKIADLIAAIVMNARNVGNVMAVQIMPGFFW